MGYCTSLGITWIRRYRARLGCVWAAEPCCPI